MLIPRISGDLSTSGLATSLGIPTFEVFEDFTSEVFSDKLLPLEDELDDEELELDEAISITTS